ncbi:MULTISPECIES: cbb3-type cytochrome oxidase assembly protein CcoS [unclassified Cupriavidus]|uniref:cbb3-type cytochrome oxidase assembly protein CcoS n=1 Tax=unclassified Cupriavidus TaxID=2640874 RepID=UPI0010F80070|nr:MULTISPECIES: cbb3-type cytochrome oxidase assembly protein CcoS [unclassified Cupriavidus]MWL87593.1 cbb3-type cytochrome oxidase assembly protein CcoS [Cupriavidus sp. SW-Y-13]
METLYLLVPMSLVLAALIAGALWWALHAGQYDDLERPGEAILLDNDTPADLTRIGRSSRGSDKS